MSTMKHYADVQTGAYIGGTDSEAPPNSIEVPIPPAADWFWKNDQWVPPPVQPDRVDAERDRRIGTGFTFQGHPYQTGDGDRENIAGAAQIAFMAVVNGAAVGNLRWASTDRDFVWIDSNNVLVPMDAQTVVLMGQAAAAWKTRHIYAARELKSKNPIPMDYTDDKYWV